MPADDESTSGAADRERLHAYVAAFLSPAASDEVVQELDVHGARSTRDLLRAAHERLAARIDVPGDIEVAVLMEDLGLSAHDVAYVVGLPVETVHSIARTEGLGTPPAWPERSAGSSAEPVPVEPAPEPPEPQLVEEDSVPPLFDDEIEDAAPRDAGLQPRRRMLGWLVIALGLAAALAIAFGTSGGGTVSDCIATPEQPVCVVEARLTDVVDGSGTPGAARSRFDVGEPIKLWFAFDTLVGAEDTVDYVWYRDDEVLYASSFQLPPGGRVNLSLARVFAREPGQYRIEVRDGDDLLVDETFTIG